MRLALWSITSGEISESINELAAVLPLQGCVAHWIELKKNQFAPIAEVFQVAAGSESSVCIQWSNFPHM